MSKFLKINKVFDMPKEDHYTEKGEHIIDTYEQVIAPIIVNVDDIERVYTNMGERKRLSFVIYNKKHKEYEHIEEVFDTTSKLLNRLEELEKLMN